ncbi:MAG: NADase-type glycan-binding domain-containing protein [Bacteroidales bacterium]
MTQKLFLAFISFLSFHAISQDLITVRSEIVDQSSEIYQLSIVEYQTEDYWAIWSGCPGEPFASSFLTPQQFNHYGVSNICDFDLKTAWVVSNEESGVGEKFGFTLDFQEGSKYGEAYQFYGILNVFNGYCKSLKTWTENARLKILKLYLNDTPVCFIELIDTWHFQQFDLRVFFQNEYDTRFEDGFFEIKNGDNLTFEIIEIYPGTKYSDVAVSLFMAELAGN